MTSGFSKPDGLGSALRVARIGTVAALSLALVGLAQSASAQIAGSASDVPAERVTVMRAAAPALGPVASLPEPAAATEYRIGTDDLLSITVLQAPDLNASVRVPESGEISLPLIGSVRAARLTMRELELTIEQRLGERYIRDPHVTVLATEVRSHGVSVVGAVQRPGTVQIRGTSTLLEVLSLAGGLTEAAGDSVVIVRRTGEAAPATIDIKLKALLAADAAANVSLRPGDVVNVQAAAVVYVMGAVKKPGAFAVRGNDQVTVLRALALGEGVTSTAKPRNAVVLRTTSPGQRVEIPVDLDGILKGRTPDLTLQAQDLLFVPVSGAKVASRASLDFLSRVAARGLFLF